jgi:hypothetical protein
MCENPPYRAAALTKLAGGGVAWRYERVKLRNAPLAVLVCCSAPKRDIFLNGGAGRASFFLFIGTTGVNF